MSKKVSKYRTTFEVEAESQEEAYAEFCKHVGMRLIHYMMGDFIIFSKIKEGEKISNTECE